MSNYNSENTTILATNEQAGGNTRMLLLHKCESGRLEYVIGSYFTEYKEHFDCPRCGSRLLDSDLPDYRFLCEECDENFYAFEANAAEVTSYSWDWGHYFNDFASAADYWKREVLGEPEPAKSPDSIEVECKFGKLVASVFSSEPEPFAELAVDLVRPDGRKYQVCVVGTDEGEFYESPYLRASVLEEMRSEHESIHVYIWNGDEQDCSDHFYMNPDGSGHWN